MSAFTAFSPSGNTILLTANSTAPTGLQAPATTGVGATQYHFANTGTQIVFLSYATSAALAQSGAVIPTGTGVNASAVIPIFPNSAAIYSFTGSMFFSGITASAGANNVYITPGEGL